MSSDILVREGAYSVITLREGGKFNPQSLAEVNAALDTCLADEGAQALLLTGSGKIFAQGLDLDYLGTADPGQAMTFVGDCLKMVGRLLAFPIPVVAALNGHGFGLGAMIALACDYSVMRRDRGYICLPEVDMGMTLSYRMNALVTAKLQGALLRDLLLAGKRIGGEEAAARGLVDRCCDESELLAVAKSLVEPMMGKQRTALGGLKRGINGDILAVIESDDVEAVMPAGA